MELFSPHNSLIKHFCLLRDNKAYRQQRDSFVIEGRKMLEEALARLPVKIVLATHKELLPQGVNGKLITEKLFKKITGYANSQGVLAEVLFSPQKALTKERYLLVLDNVQDPGNVGALIRAALALGWEAVILVGNCADPYGPKVVNASKGAVFRLPIISMVPSALQRYCQGKIPLIAADLKGEPFVKKGACALILGNEGHGISSEIMLLSPDIIKIPLKGDMESLNVASAGSILLYGLIG